MRRLGAVILLLGALLIGATPAAEPMPALNGYTIIHDPSVLWTPQGWVAFGTGGENTSDGGVPNVRISSDRLVWRDRGPGGQETFMVDGAPWLAFHYYDKAQGGTPKLQVAPLGWTDDGWPELGPLPQ